jgi:hypothetical protein
MAKRPNIIKNPSVLGESMITSPKKAKRALGLDLGTRTGFAYLEYDPKELPSRPLPYLGQFDLQVGGWETTPLKFIRLRQFLNVILPDVIFFEDVKQAITPAKMKMMGGIIRSVEMLGALKCTIVTWAEENGIAAHGFTIGEIKKQAMGKGTASKEDMIEACNEKFGSEFDAETYKTTGVDNSADAAFALDLGMETYCEGLQ